MDDLMQEVLARLAKLEQAVSELERNQARLDYDQVTANAVYGRAAVATVPPWKRPRPGAEACTPDTTDPVALEDDKTLEMCKSKSQLPMLPICNHDFKVVQNPYGNTMRKIE